MSLKLIKKLYNFHLHANLGFAFDGIKNHEKYTLVYHNKIKDFYYNFITDIKATTKKDFEEIMSETSSKLADKNRKVAISILPFMENIHQFLDDTYELAAHVVWQIYDDFNSLEKSSRN